MTEELTVGEVVSQTFEQWRANFLKLSLTCAIILSPILVLNLAASNSSAINAQLLNGLVAIVQLFLVPIVTGASVFAVLQRIRGRDVGVVEVLEKGFSRLFPILGTSILFGLGVFFGALLLVVPGLILSCMWAVALPATVVEDIGPGAALSRSGKLTEGYRWKVFWVGVVMWLIVTGLSAISTFIAAAMLAEAKTLSALLTWLVLVIMTPLGAIYPSIIYHKLRLAKEGLGIEDLAKVFD